MNPTNSPRVISWVLYSYFIGIDVTAAASIACVLILRGNRNINLLALCNFIWLFLGVGVFSIEIPRKQWLDLLDPYLFTFYCYLPWYILCLGYVILLQVYFWLYLLAICFFFAFLTFEVHSLAMKLQGSPNLLVIFVSLIWPSLLCILATGKIVHSNSRATTQLFVSLVKLQTSKEIEIRNVLNMKQKYVAQTLHDIGTPLTTLMLGQEFLEQAEWPEEITDIIKTNRCAIEMMTLIRKKALDFAKMDTTGKLVPTLRSVDLRDILYFRCPRIISGFITDKVRMEYLVDEQIAARVSLDGDWIWEMMCNLLSNALKFTQEGYVEASIMLSPDRTQLIFQVKDTGKGVEDKNKGQLFQPFSQLQSNAGGTGLGLYSVACRAQALGGSVGISDNIEEGHGAVFYFSVPYIPLFEPSASYLHFDGFESPKASSFKTSLKKAKFFARDKSASKMDTITETFKKPQRSTRSSFRNTGTVHIYPTAGGASPRQNSSSRRSKHLTGSSQESEKGHLRTDSPSSACRLLQASSGDLASSQGSGLCSQSLQACISGLDNTGHGESEYKMNSEPLSTIHSSNGLMMSSNALSGWAENLDIKGKILLIEDERSIAKLMTRMLEQSGFEVSYAENGEVGLEKMKTSTYRVVLCDLTMPVMNGFEAVQSFREWETQQLSSDRTKQVIIALSALETTEDQERAIYCGFSNFISKPVKIKELLNVIQTETTPFS